MRLTLQKIKDWISAIFQIVNFQLILWECWCYVYSHYSLFETASSNGRIIELFGKILHLYDHITTQFWIQHILDMRGRGWCNPQVFRLQKYLLNHLKHIFDRHFHYHIALVHSQITIDAFLYLHICMYLYILISSLWIHYQGKYVWTQHEWVETIHQFDQNVLHIVLSCNSCNSYKLKWKYSNYLVAVQELLKC